MKSIFDPEAYKEIVTRINNLNEQKNGLWGKMSAAQMVWHCQIPIRLAIENKNTGRKGNMLIRLFLKKSLYNNAPWRKNLPTAPIAKAREEKDFEWEKEILLGMLAQLYEVRGRKEWNPHPLFGSFTPEQWGQMQYKHLDHHLKQFGV